MSKSYKKKKSRRPKTFKQIVKLHKGEAVCNPGRSIIKKAGFHILKEGDVVIPSKIINRNIDILKTKKRRKK